MCLIAVITIYFPAEIRGNNNNNNNDNDNDNNNDNNNGLFNRSNQSNRSNQLFIVKRRLKSLKYNIDFGGRG